MSDHNIKVDPMKIAQYIQNLRHLFDKLEIELQKGLLEDKDNAES